MKKLILFVIVIFAYAGAFGQHYGEIGIFGGGSYYLGDLNPGRQFFLTKPAFGGFLRHNFNDRTAIRAGFTYGTIQGDDLRSKANTDRAINFTSHVSDISAVFELNFFEYFIGSLRHFITPYMFAGGSVFYFNPKAEYPGFSDQLVLHNLRTEGQNPGEMYSRWQFSVPFGIGFKYSLNSFMGIAASWTMHKTFTDYIDDVSTTYYFDPQDPDDPNRPIDEPPKRPKIEAEKASDPTGAHMKGMQRGDSSYDDWFSFAGISLSIKLNYLVKEKCLNKFY
ncbi:MAG: hypothetical protein K0B15_02185 [Lentimicrobium sp.]|nr:hypothetical protein [Lentimicrobium sp.]